MIFLVNRKRLVYDFLGNKKGSKLIGLLPLNIFV